MYDTLIKEFSAIGFLVLSFGSGVLFQKLNHLRTDFDKSQNECDKRHQYDKQVNERLVQISTKLDDLKEFRSETERNLKK